MSIDHNNRIASLEIRIAYLVDRIEALEQRLQSLAIVVGHLQGRKNQSKVNSIGTSRWLEMEPVRES